MPEPLRITLKSASRIENETLVSLIFILSNGEKNETRVLIIPEARFYELGLRRGNISPEQFNAAEEESKLCAAVRRGENLLGYSANSRKSIVRKLRQRGFDAECSNEAAKQLEARGFFNEHKDAAEEARKCVAKLWGMKRIVARLYERGYEDEAVKSACSQLADVNFVENCAALIRRRYRVVPDDRKELDKMTASLIRNGYSFQEIREAVRIVTEEK